MANVRKRAISSPDQIQLDDVIVEIPSVISPDVAAIAARTISRAEAMGLVRLDATRGFDRSALAMSIEAFQAAGIGRQTVLEKDVSTNLRGALELLSEAIEHSPHPETEWRAMDRVLGLDLVAKLTGISASSARRYSTAERVTPDEVADRLHFIVLVVADLAGSYNNFGVRRWFQRPRRLLNDTTPLDQLTGDWTSDDPVAQSVASLARSLTSLGAT